MSIPEIDIENVPDKECGIAYRIMEALAGRDDEAYKVWLLLSTKFGAMQRVYC